MMHKYEQAGKRVIDREIEREEEKRRRGRRKR